MNAVPNLAEALTTFLGLSVSESKIYLSKVLVGGKSRIPVTSSS